MACLCDFLLVCIVTKNVGSFIFLLLCFFCFFICNVIFRLYLIRNIPVTGAETGGQNDISCASLRGKEVNSIASSQLLS